MLYTFCLYIVSDFSAAGVLHLQASCPDSSDACSLSSALSCFAGSLHHFFALLKFGYGTWLRVKTHVTGETWSVREFFFLTRPTTTTMIPRAIDNDPAATGPTVTVIQRRKWGELRHVQRRAYQRSSFYMRRSPVLDEEAEEEEAGTCMGPIWYNFNLLEIPHSRPL